MSPAGEVTVEPLAPERYEEVLPLVAAYQRFYGAEPDADRNRRFFRRFLAPSDDGVLLAAVRDGELVGFATLYWTFSSVSAREHVLMNDLYVAEGRRGTGAGRRLVEAAADVARERGAPALSWMTALGNRRAQRLYEQLGAERSEWFEYELPTAR